ncbi:MAG: acetyl/propionyl/methylcrotonyl-CoA carboxylase subunit alpha [Pseudomonadota bacterium]
MFRKILIANRGEIACRIAATARRMGVATVAVYSDADVGAAHVAACDEAVALGGVRPAESYLRGDAIIAAAQATGAEAIHPGYGFLSENPDFVSAVEAAGLIFIGPSADAIRAMGLKDAAKALMEEAGVPVVPGYHGEEQQPGLLAAEAVMIGFPVLIKAVAGGGGKGMRRVDRPEDFAAALDSAKSEAMGAFGNDRVLIEKFVDKPRHIEVQVFGDGTQAVHLFERDCSLQRRHQKVIEEAPAPGMTPEMRDAMGQAAVRAAEAIGYKGAGTVEFIVDSADGLRADGFYFMEMNTRLQVEHPVTEAITGQDLVAWQLLVAAGEPLPAQQFALAISGHAFEARLYAEDVPAGFLPATGRLSHLRFADGARADTGVRPGDEVSPWYDPMIAKIIVHGTTRSAALQQLRAALSQTEVAGCVTNLAFLRALANHPGFAEGDVDTGLIGRDLEALTFTPEPCSRTKAIAGLTVLGIDGEAPPALQGFHLWAPLRQSVRLNDDITAVVETLGPGRFAVEVAGARHEVVRDAAWHIDGQPTAARSVIHSDGVSVFWGNDYHFTVPDPLATGGNAAAEGETRAPMPGLVKTVFVAAGQVVSVGDPLAVLEAMKMEHTLRAGQDGTIAQVLVSVGDQVEAGVTLIALEAEA